MPKPYSDYRPDKEFAAIAAQGIRQIISLLEVAEAYELGLQDEENLCSSNDINFLQHPIRDRGLPDSLQNFISLTERIHSDIQAGISTAIHCRGGIGRSGLLGAAVLMQAGYCGKEAFALISEKRGVGVPDTEEQRLWLLEHERAFMAAP